MDRSVLGLLAFLFFTLPAREGFAQTDTLIPGPASCAACVIHLQRIATLSDQDTGGAFSDFASISSDRTGSFLYVVSPLARHEFLVFDSHGRFLNKVGRSGSGPGEYRMIAAPIKSPDGNLHVFDFRLARHTVLDAHYKYLRSSTLPFLPLADYQFLSDGTLVFNSNVRDRNRAGLPLHIMQGDVKSFGAEQAVLSADRPYALDRRFAPDAGATFWAAHVNEYRIELWHTDGRRLRTIVRQPEWFRPWTRPAGPIDSHRPEPRIQAIWRDDADRLWILLSVADPRYRPLTTQPASPEGRRLTGAEREAIWAAVIEVIDLKTNRLVAVHNSAMNLQYVKDSGLLSTYREDSEGNPLFDIWRPVLTRINGR